MVREFVRTSWGKKTGAFGLDLTNEKEHDQQERLLEMYDVDVPFEQVRMLTASYSQRLLSRAISVAILVNWTRMVLLALQFGHE